MKLIPMELSEIDFTVSSITRLGFTALLALSSCGSPNTGGSDSVLNSRGAEEVHAGLVGGTIVSGAIDHRAKSTARIQMKMKDGIASCTATAVTSRVLLTAAHCVIGGTKLNVQLTAAPNQRVVALAVIAHPDFEKKGTSDIALILVKDAFPSSVVIAEMATEATTLKLEQTLVSYGYGIYEVEEEEYLFGLIQHTNRHMDQRLRKAPFKLVAAKDTGAIGNQSFDAEILLTVAEGASLCQGDSGGPTFLPVTNKATVVGVNSFINTKDCKNSLNGIADIRYHTGWIQAAIQELHKRSSQKSQSQPRPNQQRPSPQPNSKPKQIAKPG